jgi:GNAT superfamily N-acetyltransferase
MVSTSRGAPRIIFEASPSPETRAALGREINDFHSRSVPHGSRRFGLLARDEGDALVAGLIGTLSWGWLFIEALWVADALRGGGVGRTLMERAEDHAAAEGCHSAWLDTFQAREFYLALGYTPFGVLENYPPGQSRYFLKKRLS